MIRTRDLYNSINEVLVLLYPSTTVYTPERQPKDFARPSFLIEHINTISVDKNRFMVQKTVYFTVTAYLKVDKYNRSAVLDLIDVQDKLLEGFGKGYIKVEDRAIKLESSSGGTDRDRIYIELQYEYTDDRFDTSNQEELPLIQTVNTYFKEV